MDGVLPKFGSTLAASQYANRDSTRSSGFETTPKLPSIQISQKTSGNGVYPNILNEAAELTKPSEDADARVKISYIARDAALKLLKQYKKLVSIQSISTSDIPSSPTKSSGNAQGSKVPKRFDKNGRRGYVFTEGISSISKRQIPSFSMPKDHIVRANLPSDIVVDNQGNQYALSVNQKREKVAKKLQDSPKYKQIRMFGLDNLPLIDLGKYTTKKTSDGQKASTSKTGTSQNSQGKLIKHSVLASKQFGSTPPRKNGRNISVSTSSSGDAETPASQKNSVKRVSTHERRRHRPLTRHLAGSRHDNKMNVVSVGPHVNGRTYVAPRRQTSTNLQPHDWNYRVNENYRQISQSRNPALNGMYSLAPIRFGTQVPYVTPLNFDSDVPKRYSKRTNEARQLMQHRENTENDMYVYFEADTSRSNSSLRRRKLNRSRKTSANSSSTMTSHSLHNPPPSFVSSGSDDSHSTSRYNESVKSMLPVHEESANDCQALNLKEYISPTPQIDNPSPVESGQSQESPKSLKMVKETAIGNIITLGADLSSDSDRSKNTSPKFDGTEFNGKGFLAVPMVSIEKESRPPIRQTVCAKTDLSGLPVNDSPSKLKVQTLQLFTENQHDSGVVNSIQTSSIDTPVISVTTDSGINETIHDNSKQSKESFSTDLQKMSISKKTMEFVSPLEVQVNAKRQ